MTPQSILEGMAAFAQAFGDDGHQKLYHPYYWAWATRLAETAVHFDFGEIKFGKEHADFGYDMLERGLFALPFKTVLYTGRCWGRTGVIVSQAECDSDLLEFIIFNNLGDETVIGSKSLPCIECQVVEFLDGELVMNAGAMSSAMSGSVPSERLHETAAQCLHAIMAGTSLMMSKDAETRTEAAPTKLNKRREEQGRPLIRERRVVVIKPERRASYANAASDFAGHKSSPRMHWRRGHFRQIGEGRVVPVAPSIVNGNGDHIPKAKDYSIQ